MAKKEKSTFLPALIILFISVASSWLPGNELAGVWHETRFNIRLQLAQGGTYSLQFSGGASNGRYSFDGRRLCLQDVSGLSPVCYTLAGLSGSAMQLVDVNGVQMNFQRQDGAVKGASAADHSQVLARRDNRVLSMGHFNAGLGILQFIIGQQVKPAEKVELEKKLIEEFNLEPAEVLRQLNSLAESLNTIRRSSDPLLVGLARQELFAALYRTTMGLREADKPLMIQIMNRYLKVLAFDAANNLLLTNRDVEGMINYLAFNSAQMGSELQLSDSLRRSLTDDLVKGFANMPLEQKKIICSASLIWELLEFNWNNLSRQQQGQYQQNYQTRIGAGSRAHQSAAAKSPAEMMRESNARQHMFQMMNEMNLNSHALSLNIIENIGGTGNYWSVIDY